MTTNLCGRCGSELTESRHDGHGGLVATWDCPDHGQVIRVFDGGDLDPVRASVGAVRGPMTADEIRAALPSWDSPRELRPFPVRRDQALMLGWLEEDG